MMLQLLTKLEYEWQPFTLSGRHLSFEEHATSRLQQSKCSHWGPAVYRWEGHIDRGPQLGQTGVLIGETGDLRQRIKQYVSGTQKRGNKLWRESFLSMGKIKLYVLHIQEFSVGNKAFPRN